MTPRFQKWIASSVFALGICTAFTLAPLTDAHAQTPSPAAKPQEPATQPSTGATSGTAPGNAGSSGWSGSGMGGSHTGTTPNAQTPASPTEQPETAKGLNPQPKTQ